MPFNSINPSTFNLEPLHPHPARNHSHHDVYVCLGASDHTSQGLWTALSLLGESWNFVSQDISAAIAVISKLY